jgi:hypothetical protein
MVGEARLAYLEFSDGKLAETLHAALESSDESFFRRHESRTLGWRLIDLVPRRELVNAPARASHASVHLEEDLPVPLGWPKLAFTVWPTTGHRHPETHRRGGPLLLHWSVRPLVEAGQYALDDVSYVEDAPLPEQAGGAGGLNRGPL